MNDRRREAEQRVAARLAFQHAKEAQREKLTRYVKSVLRSRAGEVVTSHDGRKYQVQDDGSLVRVRGEGVS